MDEAGSDDKRQDGRGRRAGESRSAGGTSSVAASGQAAGEASTERFRAQGKGLFDDVADDSSALAALSSLTKPGGRSNPPCT